MHRCVHVETGECARCRFLRSIVIADEGPDRDAPTDPANAPI